MQINSLDSALFKKVVNISKQIDNRFYQKGVAIPSKNKDGSIKLGNYTIVKNNGLFLIKDYSNQIVVKQINLPHTAILLANSLALGKFMDTQLLDNDRKYGFAIFEEQKYGSKSKNLSVDKLVLFESKLTDARLKKDMYRKYVLNKFEKFVKMYK